MEAVRVVAVCAHSLLVQVQVNLLHRVLPLQQMLVPLVCMSTCMLLMLPSLFVRLSQAGRGSVIASGYLFNFVMSFTNNEQKGGRTGRREVGEKKRETLWK